MATCTSTDSWGDAMLLQHSCCAASSFSEDLDAGVVKNSCDGEVFAQSDVRLHIRLIPSHLPHQSSVHPAASKVPSTKQKDRNHGMA